MQWNEVAACNNCGATGSKLYLESSAPRWYEGRALRLVECTDCGLVRVSPRPDRQELYRDYLAGGPEAQDAVQRKLDRKNVHDVHRKHVDTAITALGRTPELLYDMGCGAGTVMTAAREMGLVAEGNDINKAAVDRLREDGFHALHGFTDELDLPSERYDVVINFDYLEHSYLPKEDLATCLRILRPGGIMYVKTLYLGCPAHVEKGERWQLFGIGHFHFFSSDLLCTMIRNAGFEIVDVSLGQLVFIIARRPAVSTVG